MLTCSPCTWRWRWLSVLNINVLSHMTGFGGPAGLTGTPMANQASGSGAARGTDPSSSPLATTSVDSARLESIREKMRGNVMLTTSCAYCSMTPCEACVIYVIYLIITGCIYPALGGGTASSLSGTSPLPINSANPALTLQMHRQPQPAAAGGSAYDASGALSPRVRADVQSLCCRSKN